MEAKISRRVGNVFFGNPNFIFAFVEAISAFNLFRSLEKMPCKISFSIVVIFNKMQRWGFAFCVYPFISALV